MKAIAVLLAVAVGTNALQPGLEYQYRYKARVAHGVTQVNRQFAAAGIQGDVTIQVTDDYTTYFKFSNVEVGEMNEKVDCDLRKPLPMEYHPIQREAELLQKPFRVTVNGTKYPEYMETPEEPVWVSNIRKSVVNIFRIAPIWDHTGKVEQLNFGMEEETLVGRCINYYTSMKYPEHMADKFTHDREEYMEEDVQRGHKESRFRPHKSVTSGSSSVPLEESLWWVTRNTDFDSCEDIVELKMHGNRHSDDVISRSSTGKYVIRGDEHRRLEQAVVEATITVFTNHEETDNDNTFDDAQRYGYMNTFRNHERYDHIDTFTNQTVELKAVREISSQMSLDYTPEEHYNWNYDIEHPEKEKYIPVEQLITGRPIDDNKQAEIVEFIKKYLNEMASWMDNQPNHDKKLVYEYTRLVEAVNNLDYEHIKALHTELYANGADDLKLYIFHELIIYSGTMDAVKFAVEKFKDSNFDDHFHMRNEFYDVMDHTVQHPDSINRIMDLLMSEEESETHNFGLMSFSSLVHDMCLGRDRQYYYYDYNYDTYGHCDQEHIINDFIPFLKRGMENTAVPLWRRLMYLQALSNLGTPHTIEILKPYMMGVDSNLNTAHDDDDVFFRTNAIWSLNSYNMHETAEEYVYNILMPIMENKRERFEIRNMAFLTMASWRPSLSWWKRMAVSTWHDPSPQFTNFVYSTIDSIAHSNTPRNETLARVLHLVKPASPPSVIHSTNLFLYEYLFNEEMGTHVNFAWFASVEGYFPEEVFIRLRQEVFYGYQMVAKFDFQQRGFDMLTKMFESFLPDFQSKDEGAKAMIQGVWNEAKEKLGFKWDHDTSDFRLWAKFDRLIFLANEFPISTEFFKNTEGMEFLKHVVQTFQHPHYFRTLRSYIAVPTEVGLPFSVQYSINHAFWMNVKSNPSSSFNDMKYKGSMEITIDYSIESYVETRTHLPWSDHPAINAGLYADGQVILPFLIHATFDMKNYEFHISAEPIKNEKFTIYSFHVSPYTVLENNFPAEVLMQENEYKVILHDDERLYKYKGQALPSEAGLWVETRRKGDEYYYWSLQDWMRRFRTTLHMNNWEHDVVYDPSASSTKSVSFTFNYMYSGDGERSREMSDKMQHISEIQNKIKGSSSNVRTVSVDMELNGSPKRHYQASFTWSRSFTRSHFNTKMQLAFSRDNHVTCVNGNIMKPNLRPFSTLRELFDTEYHTTMHAEIFDGETCDQSPVAEFEVALDVSAEAKNKVRKSVDEHCEYNTVTPAIDIITSPVYDHFDFKANWQESFPDNLKNVTYFVYDLFRGAAYNNIEFDYTAHNEDRKIHIDAHRNLETHHWTARTEKPSEVSVIHELNTPMWMDVIASPAPVDHTVMYDFMSGRQPHACHITNDKIRTFDGYEYDFAPEECWSALTVERDHSNEAASFVRFINGHWELKILWPAAGIMLDITPTSVLLNGEAVQGYDDRFTVHQYDDSHVIEFYEGSRCRVSNEGVEYLLMPQWRGYSRGLCGNFDGEPMNDLVGPKMCYYTDYQLFARSWMTHIEGGCGDFESKVADVHSYQNDCPHDMYQATGETYKEGKTDCTEWEYHERDEGDYHCKSLSPIPKCKSGCYAKFPHHQDMEYECKYQGHKEHESKHSHSVEESYSHTYFLTYPAYCLHQ